jgi:hypothetical protein
MLNYGGLQAFTFFLGGNKMKKLFAVLFAALVMGLSAHAATITYTDSVTGIFDEVSDADATLYIPQFNSSLGILNSITINLSTALQGDLGFENLKKFTGGTFNFSTQNVYAYLVLGLSGSGMIMSGYSDSQTYTVTLAKYDGVIDYAGTSGTIVTTFSDADTQTYADFTDAGFLTQFTGTGNMDFTIMSDSLSSLGLPSNSAAIINTTGQASVSVTYNYTVPEPATMAVLSLGGLLFKRKK